MLRSRKDTLQITAHSLTGSTWILAVRKLIDLLPALPKAWPTGSVKGLRARGAFTVNMAWKHGLLQGATIQSLKGTPLTVTYGGQTVNMDTTPKGVYHFDPQSIGDGHQ